MTVLGDIAKGGVAAAIEAAAKSGAASISALESNFSALVGGMIGYGGLR
jgi:hypothetical protein